MALVREPVKSPAATVHPLVADAARFRRHAPGGRWFVDETHVKVNGVWRYVYRAVDQDGQVVDVLLSGRRDAAAARRFFVRALRASRAWPYRGMGRDDGRVAMKDKALASLAGQLRQPHGLAGWTMGSMLNRANRAAVTAAVGVLAPAPGEVGADVGFGGGLSLALLLDRVGATGRVHGCDISRRMLDRARRRHRRALAEGRLELHEASMTDLPIAGVSIDAAMSVNTIYFVGDEAFAGLARMLSRNGRLVLGFGDPAAMAREPVTGHGFRIRPLADIVALLHTAGLTVVDHHRVGSGPDAFHLLAAQHNQDRTPGPAN